MNQGAEVCHSGNWLDVVGIWVHFLVSRVFSPPLHPKVALEPMQPSVSGYKEFLHG